MKTTQRGQLAEMAVANYLQSLGWQIVARNWRTKVCEIDIVAKSQGSICFVEVKYRSQDAQGDGLAYITAQKLKRLHFAASIWIQNHDWEGDYRLLAASVTGNGQALQVEELVELE